MSCFHRYRKHEYSDTIVAYSTYCLMNTIQCHYTPQLLTHTQHTHTHTHTHTCMRTHTHTCTRTHTQHTHTCAYTHTKTPHSHTYMKPLQHQSRITSDSTHMGFSHQFSFSMNINAKYLKDTVIHLVYLKI